MAVPFGKMTRKVVDNEAQDYEIRDMLRSFAKVMFDNPSKIMRDFDKVSIDYPRGSEGSAFMSVLPESHLDCDCKVLLGRTSILSLLAGKVSSSPEIKKLLTHFGNSATRGEHLLILFKVKHLGLFVAHNMALPYTSTPRIVIASSAKGTDAIQIQSLKSFAADNTQRKEV
jgi:hypothetical protein